MITAGMAAMLGGGSGAAMKYGMDINAIFGDVVDGVLQMPSGAIFDLDFSGVETFATGNDAYYWFYKFYRNSTIRSVTFPDLKELYSMNYTFEYNANLREAHFDSLSSISYFQSTFYTCSALTSVTFPELQNVGANGLQQAFSNDTGLSSMAFPKLTTAGPNAFSYTFSGCSALTSVTFPELTSLASGVFGNCFTGTGVQTLSFPKAASLITTRTVSGAPFYNCSDLTALYLPAVTSIGTTSNNVFNGCTNLVEIHFAAANENTIKAMAGYSVKWNAPNAECQILFDL